MPLPRFARVPEQVRTRIRAAVRRRSLAEGVDRVGLQPVMAEAGLSRSAAYNYFDGRDDLVDWAIDEALAELAAILSTWEPQRDGEAFWRSLLAGETRLRAALAGDPSLRALVAASRRPRVDGADRPDPAAWLRAAFADAVALGLVDTSPGREVIEHVTLAAVAALDELELATPGSLPPDALRAVLSRLWSPPSED